MQNRNSYFLEGLTLTLVDCHCIGKADRKLRPDEASRRITLVRRLERHLAEHNFLALSFASQNLAFDRLNDHETLTVGLTHVLSETSDDHSSTIAMALVDVDVPQQNDDAAFL